MEWTHAVAPRAKIVYVGAANTTKGLDQALNEVVDKHLGERRLQQLGHGRE